MLLRVQELLPTAAPGAVLPDTDHAEGLAALRPLIGRARAEAIMESVGVYGLARRTPDELVHELGLPRPHARRVLAARALADLLARSRVEVTAAKDVIQCLPVGYARYEREVMSAIVMNNQMERTATILIAAGGTQVVCMSPIDVLRPVLRFGGTGFILVHNHPSGSPEPSESDVIFTNKVAKAAWIVGLKLLDHIIIAERGTVSFHETGLLPTEEELEGEGRHA